VRVELVVVRPWLVLRAEDERAAGHVDLVGAHRRAIRARGHRDGVRAALPELQRLEHRLLRGELVLDDEPEREAASDERVGALQVDVLQKVECARADVRRVGLNGLCSQRRQSRAVPPGAPERVVDVPVHIGDGRRTADVAEDPQLLEVRDVREAPHEGRRVRGDLRGELVLGDRPEHLVGALPCALHELPDLDPRGHLRSDYRPVARKD
jgi:hypothetical protein